MKIVTPFRAAVLAAAVFAALSLSLGFVVIEHGDAQAQAVQPFSGDQHSKACARSKHDLERNKRNVVAYYTMSFNDKNPRERSSCTAATSTSSTTRWPPTASTPSSRSWRASPQRSRTRTSTSGGSSPSATS
jgi:hypothetical protein